MLQLGRQNSNRANPILSPMIDQLVSLLRVLAIPVCRANNGANRADLQLCLYYVNNAASPQSARARQT